MKVLTSIIVMPFETDLGGVVSNTRYLEYLERGRAALMRASGISVAHLWEEHGVQFIVRRAEVDYLGFARHEEELQLETRVVQYTGATTIIGHELSRAADGAIILRAQQTLAYLNTKWRPVRVPAFLREALPAEL
ncbi:MAG TPA: thioesterase family protein [Abditibacteriaceae bacterium]|jgi:acyl-CoA thioester hydrolase